MDKVAKRQVWSWGSCQVGKAETLDTPSSRIVTGGDKMGELSNLPILQRQPHQFRGLGCRLAEPFTLFNDVLFAGTYQSNTVALAPMPAGLAVSPIEFTAADVLSPGLTLVWQPCGKSAACQP